MNIRCTVVAKIKLKLIILHLVNVRMSLDHHLAKVLADSHIRPHYRVPGVFHSPGGEANFIHTAQASNTRTA